jgi:hypothetical protein
LNEHAKQRLLEALVAVALLLGLFWLLSHYLPRTPAATLGTNDPTGQSAQGNFFPVVTETPVGIPIASPSQQPIDLVFLTPNKAYGGELEQCDCGTGTNCPVSPYTIASINKMQALGTAYANAMISAGNNTAAAIAQLGDLQFTFPVLQLNPLQAA